MPELIAPTIHLHGAWSEAHEEWGPGLHEDGFALKESDDVGSAAGFAAWVARLTDAADPARHHDSGHVFRWIVEGDQVLGGIALRYEFDGAAPPLGHLGYGVRPSARGRGVATWALGRMLGEARRVGLAHVRIMCAPDNLASARVIERQGGVLEGIVETRFGPARSYRIDLGPDGTR
ncbi:GNAT family N-acetyltransferase [Krasilnikovia sp. MM14-A1259]|uniref:GNAT family N-acetyltransferase n=1 Tax=Krasilnikovia sp. MM14-A1259 TaxID=3373539 RepID=UPI00399C8851